MPNLKNERCQLSVLPRFAGKRIDVFLTNALKDYTRARFQKLIRDGHVKVGGRKVKTSYPVKDGDKVFVEIPPPQVHDVAAEKIPLHILYEDSDIIVVNKPANMVVHPAAGNWGGTLVNALLAHCGSMSVVGGEEKPGIVHRLDKGTSGVIVAAKNDASHLELSRQFKDREVMKIYRALVYGSFNKDSGAIDKSIGRSLRDRKKFSAKTKKGRAALTEWKAVKNFDKELTLLEIRLRTGRTHQIRVHFAEEGHPLVGDAVYGGTGRVRQICSVDRRRIISSFKRPALHALRLGFKHPRSGEWMEFEAPLPEDFKDLLESL
jgi:23S rRNA pseudouridine1911/1915/1917 synthase